MKLFIMEIKISLEEAVGQALREHGLRLALAESCTGGLVGHRVTNIPGSSTYYMGSITAYAYGAKVRLLDVQWETLETHGAVSDETVAEMALGVRRALAADVGVSISGIAGPGGGTDEKPVGLVCFGINSAEQAHTIAQHFEGDRVAVKEQAAEFALGYILDFLKGKFDGTD